MEYCKQPDRDCPKLVCGYPLPCPHHTVIINDGKVTLPLQVPQPDVLDKVFKVAEVFKPPDEGLRELRSEVEQAMLCFALDFHRFEDIRRDIIIKGTKSHPKFIDQILTQVEAHYQGRLEEVFRVLETVDIDHLDRDWITTPICGECYQSLKERFLGRENEISVEDANSHMAR